MSKEDVMEETEEFSIEMATKFDSLKEFAFKRLRETELKVRTFDERLSKVEEYMTELNLKRDIEILDDSLNSLRSDFEKFRNTSNGSVASQEGTVKSRMDTSNPIVFRESPSVFPKPFIHLRQMDTTPDKENPMIKKQRALSGGFALSEKTQEANSTPPRTLDDIQDASLKSDLERYYTPKPNPAETLTPVQHAFVQYFLLERRMVSQVRYLVLLVDHVLKTSATVSGLFQLCTYQFYMAANKPICFWMNFIPV